MIFCYPAMLVGPAVTMIFTFCFLRNVLIIISVSLPFSLGTVIITALTLSQIWVETTSGNYDVNMKCRL